MTDKERLQGIFTIHPLPWQVDARPMYNNSLLDANSRLIIDVQGHSISSEDDAVLATHIAQLVNIWPHIKDLELDAYYKLEEQYNRTKAALAELVRTIKVNKLIDHTIVHQLVEAEKVLDPQKYNQTTV